MRSVGRIFNQHTSFLDSTLTNLVFFLLVQFSSAKVCSLPCVRHITMSRLASFVEKLLDPDLLLAEAAVTVMRDSTDAADSIPLLFHLVRSFLTARKLVARQVVILTTRTRPSYTEPSPHIHPVVPAAVSHALSSCHAVDAHPQFRPTRPLTHSDALRQLIFTVQAAISDASSFVKPRLVVIECLHSLRFSFAVDPSAFIRSLSAIDPSISIIMAAPVACGIDRDLSSITSLAHNVIDLSDLRTGVATDIDGHIVVAKSNGRWLSDPQQRRYKITDRTFTIST